MRATAERKRFSSISLRRPTASQLVKLALLLAPFAIAAVAFFWKFRSMGLSHWDEYIFVGTAASMSPSVGWGHLYPYDPPLFALFLFAMFKRFGFYDYVAVATSGIIAFALCIAVFVWVNRQYDRWTAIVSTSILATIELFIFYAKMALSDMAFTFFFSLSVFAYFGAIKNQKGSSYLLAGLLLTLAIATKYNGFQPLLVVAIFIPFFHSMLLRSRGRTPREAIVGWARAVLHSLSGLWLSAAPAVIFVVLFLAFLGQPFHLTDFRAMLGITRDLVPRVSEGLAYFVRVVYPTKGGVFRIRPFITVGFYSDALTHFIAAPVLALSVIGAVKGIMKRSLVEILLTIWAGFIFVYFASTATTYVRVLLPAVVPIAILAGTGLTWLLAALDQSLRTQKASTLRKRNVRALIEAGLLLAVIGVNVIWAAPAITDTHSAYRTAADFIVKNVPDGQLVWFTAQPIIITYLDMMRKQVRISDNISAIEQAYVIVLDFVAQSSPQWPQIQARISQMQLVFTVRNDVPVVNVLDWTDFSHLNSVISDPARMSIRIYASAGQIPSYQADPVSPYAMIAGLMRRPAVLRRTP